MAFLHSRAPEPLVLGNQKKGFLSHQCTNGIVRRGGIVPHCNLNGRVRIEVGYFGIGTSPTSLGTL
jgi:hypothetical protein